MRKLKICECSQVWEQRPDYNRLYGGYLADGKLEYTLSESKSGGAFGAGEDYIVFTGKEYLQAQYFNWLTTASGEYETDGTLNGYGG